VNVGAGAATSAARELSPLARGDSAQSQPQQQASDAVALEHLVIPLQSSTAAAALIPRQQVPPGSLPPPKGGLVMFS